MTAEEALNEVIALEEKSLKAQSKKF